ncbi:hypothetical protein NRS6120_14365 [Bacillus subtilis]|nr:L-tyrosine/L-tryptophan isonitrile synthase family protein [Bacillus subtilis]CAF1770820.1 hypothetical protein NRS6120_02114 [Bacillus subtilis]CAI6291205.1 hypothetical protein NRS6120_14365 [Bacillus subtilis]
MTVKNKYGYVSFSKPQFSESINELIDSAMNWDYIKGTIIKSFDFKGWMEKARKDTSNNNIAEQESYSNDSLVLSNKILDILLLDQYRKGPRENVEKYREDIISKIKHKVDQNESIEIIIPSFPGRPINPLTRTRTQPDLGEIASFTRLWTISNHISKIYEPGVSFIIVLDGRAYAPFYGYTPESLRPYVRDLQKIIENLELSNIIKLTDLQSLVEKREEEFKARYQETVKELKEVWEDPNYNFRDELIHSMKLGTNTAATNAAMIKLLKFYNSDFDIGEIINQMRQATYKRAYHTAFEYMCFLVTIKKIDLLQTEFPHAIRGTVHPKEGQYSPHLVNEHTSIVPWHGVAVLRENGRVDSVYESKILEQPQKYKAVYIEGEYTPFYYEESDE